MIIKGKKTIHKELERISSTILEKKALFFVGSAISLASPSNMPSWTAIHKEIVAALITRCPELGRHFSKIAARDVPMELFLQTIMDELDVAPDEILSLLKVYSGGFPNLNHLFLARAAQDGYFSAILTTNFDELIEIALKLVGSRGKSYYDEKSLRTLKINDAGLIKLIKLHGTVSKIRSIQASVRQVGLGLPPNKRQALEYCLEHHVVIFVGYSSRDPDINAAIKGSEYKKIYWVLEPSNHTQKTGLRPEPVNLPNVIALEIELNEFFSFLWERIVARREQPLVAVRKPFDKLDELSVYCITAHSLQNLGYTTIAERLWRHVSDLGRKHPVDIHRRKALASLAEIETFKGREDKALIYLEESLKLCKKTNDIVGEVSVLNHLGVISYYAGEYRDALETFQGALKKSRGIKTLDARYFLQAATLTNMGNVYFRKGDLRRAEQFYLKALRKHEGAGNRERMPLVYANLGQICKENCDFDKALYYYDTAKNINNIYKTSYIDVLIYSGYTAVFIQQEKYTKALENARLCLKTASQSGDPHGVAQATCFMGAIYYGKNELDTAVGFYRTGIRRLLRLSHLKEVGYDLAQNYYEIGLVLGKKGEAKRAIASFKRGLKISKEISHDELTLRINEHLKKLYR